MTIAAGATRQIMFPASRAVLLAMALLLTPMGQANSVGTVPMEDRGDQALLKCGAARLKVLFWDIYESSLYTPDGTWSEGVRPLRLDIRYLRAISALDLVKQTGKEWAEQGKSSPETHRVAGRAAVYLARCHRGRRHLTGDRSQRRVHLPVQRQRHRHHWGPTVR